VQLARALPKHNFTPLFLELLKQMDKTNMVEEVFKDAIERRK
jgi:hypothetical protein